MSQNLLFSFGLAGIVRCFLITSNFAETIRNRVEVSTPLNSWKRIQEGAFLYENNINPYSGDLYHENPLILYASNFLIRNASPFIPYLFVGCDLLCAFLLFRMAKVLIAQMFVGQQRRLKHYAKGTQQLHIKANDLVDIPIFVALAYLFNPYTVFNCVGQTTTVWSNLFLAAFFFFLIRKQTLLCCLCLALETQRNFYPIELIIPASLYLSSYEVDDDDAIDLIENTTFKWRNVFNVIIKFGLILTGLHIVSYCIVNDWSFLDSTYGFILNHRDLQPNIGLFWYFFTEMFEHFRPLFLFSFQLNATILYLVPLTIKLQKQPIFLATILIALTSIFRSYPCVGDVAFYMALIPLWKHSTVLMANYFIVFCFFLITSALGPTVWYLWIYCNSANANFYFGATLAFASAQIFLVTDLLFASNKRDFCLRHGLNRLNQLILE
ncbi:phosphatidylinositol glycan anchor biosynthesis class U protein [Sitodiplosis mosellana]|uniref:phosphatidylinositol glycan anchor biosynthesis class U protein n=1 Tax=Sitodiplosis mosellana TaxID=263140 RepID=UPI002444A86E|nr:phosphatidylinositol glycan anchor biosynthesis class U protein [Sitodiplosis mosellana]